MTEHKTGHAAHFTLFPTTLGECAIAWKDELVIATHLPDATPEKTAASLAGRTQATAGKPPAVIDYAIQSITALLAGERVELSSIACDLSGIDVFSAQVYACTRSIPTGETRTYGEIAAELGNKNFARQVGRALGRNPFPVIVPCHRVMGANGMLTGFSAPGGKDTKLALLEIERSANGASPGLFDDLPLAARQPH